MELDYVRLAPGFAREVLEIYENWEGKESVPIKLKELMMVIEIEVNKLYDPGSWDRIYRTPSWLRYSTSSLGVLLSKTKRFSSPNLMGSVY